VKHESKQVDRQLKKA
jgi:hypothetical protein